MVLNARFYFFFKESLIISMIFIGTNLIAQETLVLSLNDCVQKGLDYNYGVRQARNNTIASRSDNIAAFGAMLPQINANSGNFWNAGLTVDPVTNIIARVPLSSANAGLGFSTILFDGFQTMNSWRQAKVNTLIAKYDLDNTLNTVALNTASQYLSVLMAKEVLKVANEQLKVTDIGVSRLRKLNAAGAISPNELLQMEAQLARDEQRHLTAENSLGLSKLILAQGIGMKTNMFVISEIGLNELMEQPRIIRIRPEAIFASSMDIQPNVKAAQLRIESADFGLKATIARRMPRLTMNGQISTSYSDQAIDIIYSDLQAIEIGYWLNSSGDNVSVYHPVEVRVPLGVESKTLETQLSENVRQYVGLNLSVPIFNGFQISNAIKRAKIGRMNAELQYEQEVDNFEQTVERSHADATSAWKQYIAAQKTVDASYKAFVDATIRRQEGTLTVYDYSSVQNTYLAAVSDALSAKYDAQFKAYILKFYMKSPLKSVQEN